MCLSSNQKKMGITAHFSLPVTFPFRLSNAVFQAGAGGTHDSKCGGLQKELRTTVGYQNATSQGKEAKAHRLDGQRCFRLLALKISEIPRERL